MDKEPHEFSRPPTCICHNSSRCLPRVQVDLDGSMRIEDPHPVHRIGVIGSLSVRTALDTKFADCLEQLRNGLADAKRTSLEILTPNAPGFDRVATVRIANWWLDATGRTARVVVLETASHQLLDRRAAEHAIAQGATRIEDVLEQYRAQGLALQRLTDTGHEIEHLSLFYPGHTDSDIDRDFETAIARAQTEMMQRADTIMFDTNDGQGKWTMRALAEWRASAGHALVVG